MEALNAFLPAAWSHNNPIDMLGDASPERYAKAVEIAAKDPNSDGLLVILTPQAMTDPTQTAEHLKPYAKHRRQADAGKLDGRRRGGRRRSHPQPGRIPTFPYPDTAARAFTYMWRCGLQLEGPLRNAVAARGFRRWHAQHDA